MLITVYLIHAKMRATVTQLRLAITAHASRVLKDQIAIVSESIYFVISNKRSCNRMKMIEISNDLKQREESVESSKL